MKTIKVLTIMQLALVMIAVPVVMVARRNGSKDNSSITLQESQLQNSSQEHGFHVMTSLQEWVGDTNETHQEVTSFTSWSWSKVKNGVEAAIYGKTVVQTFVWKQIYAAILAWGRVAEMVMEGFSTFFQWMSEQFSSYEQLKDEALNRYTELNEEIEALTVEHQQLVQMCLHPADEETRSKCIDSFLVIHDCLLPLRRQRRRAHNQYLKYEKYAERSKIMGDEVSKVEM